MSFFDITEHVKTSKEVVPTIYSYTTPEVHSHDGWTKIGYTEQDVETRINQQTHTANVKWNLEWSGNAVFEGGGTFRDEAFHAYLGKLGVERMTPEAPGKKSPEWFHVDGPTGKSYFRDFRENRGVIGVGMGAPEPIHYTLRSEQDEAVTHTLDYMRLHERGEFLWNCKPRFGKTLTAYDFCKRAQAKKVLIVTNRPAIANSWYEDYEKFLAPASGYSFVSEADALNGRPFVLSPDAYRQVLIRGGADAAKNIIAFVSLQDLKGAIDFGGKYDKLEWVKTTTWDVLVIDEAHEGVDTYKTDVAFDHIDRAFTLHLSGTPFKAIANNKFSEDATYNWTYADEQARKAAWVDDDTGENPYATLPRLNLFTYRMSEIALNKAEAGIEIDGEDTAYAFDLNEFFATNAKGHFVHNDDVDRFLDALTTQRKFPFSTPELRDELKHTLWMLNRVNSAKALAKKLLRHPVFGKYDIIIAAGDGKLSMGEDADAVEDGSDEGRMQAALDRVKKAIREHKCTITISVGQLTTGVTVPEWTAVLMLSNMKSPSLYMQAAFRAQNPCLFTCGGTHWRKENAYVFDFDPARTLTVFQQFANDLYSDTVSGKSDLDTRKSRIKQLLNFFPVLGEDADGEMIELDAERVLSIPRKIRSQEVVRRGFMCDFLFQNISCIFHAPSAVINILDVLPQFKQAAPVGITQKTAEDLDLDEDGEVNVPVEQVVGLAADLFGEKVYGDIAFDLDEVVASLMLDVSATQADENRTLDLLAEYYADTVATPLVDAAKRYYDEEMRASDKKHVERKIRADVRSAVSRAAGDYKIQVSRLDQARRTAIEAAETDEEVQTAEAGFAAEKAAAFNTFKQTLDDRRDELVQSAGMDIVRTVETAKREAKKRGIEDRVRDHLRGFSRTIPSFLMAYGDAETTLASFDSMIPADVFEDVTSITVEQFRFLRDGGDFENKETGETEHFDGNIFDPVVFNDSVREFMRLRTKLADYFDEGHTEDIFDYVPPQRTNQIFTPKAVVRQMVDLFEQENPGCFDDPTHTFADLYMKSGLFITEIVKRLYRSKRMREVLPDNGMRLRHILEEQVYGLAPTEIIYRIATNYILGPDGEYADGCETNFVRADAAELAKDGKLSEFVEKTFGTKLGST